MTDKGWMRFVAWGHVPVSGDEGDVMDVPECVVVRVEGAHRCNGCRRLHPYSLNTMVPGQPPSALADGRLFDSWEDAAHQARIWIPEDRELDTWRQSLDDEYQEGPPVTDRESAIRYLLA